MKLRKENTIIQEFADVEDFTTERPPSDINAGSGAYLMRIEATEKTGEACRKWYGVNSFDELKRVVREGWHEGVTRIYKELGQIGNDVQAVSLKRRTVRSDQGDEFDIHRAYSGGLDQAWSSRKRQARVAGGAQFTLGVCIGQYADEDSSELFWRGAVAVRLADILTEAGYQVRVVGYTLGEECYTDYGDRLLIVPVKEANQPLNLSSIASVVALAGTYRHYGLLALHREEKEVDFAHGRSYFDYELDGADLSIRKRDVKDKNSAEQFINKAVEIINSRTKRAA